MDSVIDVLGYSANSNVYVNNYNTSTYTVTHEGQAVRVIVQNGTAAPHIVIIK